ncbi:MAG: hypothetical protein LQ350_006110 [Teloschistes chrysophthalmus]|nr:MAG: hypothetical protein LQ350_006110 [Niorma chrysophthalma]
MATIKPIEGQSVHQIQSGQVIVDLCSVVKELVENSLDAGATSIDVRFRANGLESIEVQDNGSGISKENYETIALKHYTSKLATYDDLSSLHTFGFRGEALSSLCALSKFHVVTAQADEAPKGTRLDFETSGKLRATSVVASQKGTTVVVETLFAKLPVRRRELENHVKREYGKVLSLLQAYACISTSVKLSVSNVMAKGSNKAVVFATKSNTATRDNIANVFGAKTLSALVSMNLEIELQHTRRTISHAEDADNIPVRVVGHVSRPVFGEGRQTPDRQMFFVNARPCNLPQFAKVFNEVYKSYNLSQSPFVFANIIINTNAYDVNVSPDKRTILLHEQTALLDSLRNALIDLFEEQDQTIPLTQRSQPKIPAFKQPTVTSQDSESEDINGVSSNEDAVDLGASLDFRSYEGDIAESQPEPTQKTASLVEKFAGRDVRERVSEKGKALRRPPIKSLEEKTRAQASEDSIGRLPTSDEDQGAVVESDVSDEAVSTPPLRSPPSLRQVDGVEDSDNVGNDSSGEGLGEEYSVATPTQENLQRVGRILKGRGLKDSTNNLLQTLQSSCEKLESQLATFERDLQQSLKKIASSSQLSHSASEETAEQTLSLKVHKEDFLRMRIVGQFNLGFILAVRPSTTTDAGEELLIIDQHAADEKYNFERLQATYMIQNQRLVKPKTLDLTAVEEEIVTEHQAALMANGFIVDVDESGAEPVGRRCKLLSIPMTKATTFSISDLEELIALLSGSPTSTSNLTTQPSTSPNTSHIPRPSRTRSLLASRACRMSIMVGKTLQMPQMQDVVRHMGEMEKPWNCPHGRPTMRHVLGLGGCVAWEEGEEGDDLADEDDEGKVNGTDWQGWLEGGSGGETFAAHREEDGHQEIGDGGEADDDQEGQEEVVEEGDDVDMAGRDKDGLDVGDSKRKRKINDDDDQEGSQSDGKRRSTDRMGSITQRFSFS